MSDEGSGAPSPAEVPSLSLRDVSVAIDGRTALAGLAFSTRGDRVLLVGAWSPLVAVIAGISESACLERGELILKGHPLGRHRAVSGVAPRALPLPPRLSLREYLAWAARLRGERRRPARARADAVIARLGLGALATRRLDALSWPEQKAAIVAQALIADPALLIVDDPFAGLDEAGATAMLGLLAQATADRAAVLTVGSIGAGGATHALAAQASDIVVLHDGAVVLQTTPEELAEGATVFAVTAIDNVDALQALLREQGAEVTGAGGRFTVRFPAPAGVADILAAAHACDAAVIGCEPLWRL